MSILATLFRRRKRIAVVALALIAIMLSLIIAWRVQVESARYESVQLGMTVKEVEDILGPMDLGISMEFNTSARWSSIGGTIYVCFDDRHNISPPKTLSTYCISKLSPKSLESHPRQ